MPKGGNGKGKGKGNDPVPTQPTTTVLDPIIDVEINLVSEEAGGCTKMTWDEQPNMSGYSVRFVDYCGCSTTQVDTHSIEGETHYIKHWNAETAEAWIGCLWEIGKGQTYDIRICWWTRDGDEVQPWYSKIYQVSVPPGEYGVV